MFQQSPYYQNLIFVVSVVTPVIWLFGVIFQLVLLKSKLRVLREFVVEFATVMLFLSISLSPFYAVGIAYMTFAIAINLCIVAIGVWLINNGLQTARHSSLMVGAGILCLLAMIRYVDLIGNYVGAAALFGVEGLILIVTAKLLVRRNKVAKQE